MKKSQSGFTLIELVVVIVLLGILGVTALGKFQDLSGNAEAAAITGVASELSGSAAINFANSTLGNAGSIPVNTTTAAGALGCGATLLNQFFAAGTTPGTYTFAVTTPAPACAAAGDTYSCTVSKTGVTSTATATLVCTGA